MPVIPDSMKHVHPLSDSEIQEALDMNDCKPNAIISRDSPKPSITKHFYCVINLDSMDGMGTHWTALYAKDDRAYYYDSFGMPCPTEIIDWVKRTHRLFYIDNQHQPIDSVMCGYYAVYFLYSMHKGMPPSVYITLFKEDGDPENDVTLKRHFHIDQEGKGFDLVEKINSLAPNVEFHMRDVKFNDWGLPVGFQKHSFTGPNTKLNERIQNIDDLMKLPKMEDITYDQIKYITPPIDDSIDRYASVHDLQYMWGEKHAKDKKEKLDLVHSADQILQRSAYSTMKNGRAPIQKRIQGALVSLTMMLKRKLGFGNAPEPLEELKFLEKHQDKLNKLHKKFLNALKK